MKSFAETNLKKEILNAIKDIGFTEPTVIQSRTIPFLIKEGVWGEQELLLQGNGTTRHRTFSK